MIKLHQMLHGYKLGHNYIQGSIILPSTHDMDKIATLSDWSEYVGVDNMRNYITVYPLDESPYYVVAKTWYADAMRRPGCVWTHSLLIHKDDLAKITDFYNLSYLFEAPVTEEESFDNYANSLAYMEDGQEVTLDLSQISENKVAEVYERMLSCNPEFFLTEFTTQQSQDLLLSLLNYVPVEILKHKSFCSGTAAPRSYDGLFLSLQFVTHDGNSVKYLTNKCSGAWSQLVGVSVANNHPQVARLIKHYQDELGDSVEKLKGFLNVIVLINRTCQNEKEKQQVLLEIIKTLSDTFPEKEEGSVFKSAVFQPFLATDFGGEEYFLYIISTVDVKSFTEEQIEYQKRLKELSTGQFIELLRLLYNSENLNELGMQTVNEVASYISYTEISELIKTDRTFFQSIISSSPELLNQVVWSDFSKVELQSMLSVFSEKNMASSFKHWRELFRTMLDLEVPVAKELARMVLSHNSQCVGDYLTYLNVEGHKLQVPVSQELENYAEEVLRWLSNVPRINHNVAYVLINIIDETSPLVKNRGSKIWNPFSDVLSENDPIQFFVFLYILSFNWQDENALSYLRQAFYPLHQLLKQDKMEYDFWLMIEPYTDSLFLLQNWDKCKKMRRMVVRRLKNLGHSKSELDNYTPDSQTNEWLLKEW